MFIVAQYRVALRKESVDRNTVRAENAREEPQVALRKESVDRNCDSDPVADKAWVALRKESVDRNAGGFPTIKAMRGRSPQGERG